MNTKPLRIVLILSVLTALIVSGCNTMAGAGKDVERAGEKIQDNASRHR